MSNLNQELKVGGIVLCGGASSRMNYPKALLPVGNEMMLQRVVRMVASCVSPVVVIASRDQKLPELPSEVQICFDREAFLGPLAAIEQGLAALKDQCDAVYVSACDTPLIEETVIRQLVSVLQENQLAIVREGSQLHPLTAVYRVSLIETIQELLRQDRRRVVDLVELVPSAVLTTEELRIIDPDLRCLWNINTRDQYRGLLAELGLADLTPDPFAEQ